MGLRFLVNFVLLALPIGITLGVLLGLQQHRDATGQGPIFGGDDDTGGGSTPDNDDVLKVQNCDKSFGIHPESKGQNYTLNPNQWGWDGKQGGLCLDVWTNNNKTYATDTSAPEWQVTWQYDQGDVDAPVHAFPNIKVEDVFPLQIKDISNIAIDFDWTYGVGDNASTTTDDTKLKAVTLNANVAMDMFLDSNKTQAASSTNATHELMVWFAALGTATQPLGMTKDTVTVYSAKNVTIDGVKFGLYFDENSSGQFVITWMAFEVVDTFTGDLYPLVEEVMTLGKSGKTAYAKFPSDTDYIGYMSWGTEAYYSAKNVTFNVASLSIDVKSS
ncbi:hypothetical protein G7Z17_g4479 [Cylindrodendrum hubeiense]|uniref:Glycoside hydrolase family 12 protein n=1 Tax=Cylindrodendrum hubeiense TaxID=595255 RepID=A0A9P5LIW5_9HYPO|nr:hypothetical protein G7Z17_g4479 [Cylindrodendrum hubeiense]